MRSITVKPRTDAQLAGIFCDGPARVIGWTPVPQDTDVLHFVPHSRDLERALEYPHVQALSLNNLTFDAKATKALARVGPELTKVRYLTIWNCRRFDGDMLSAFPGVRYLRLGHASAKLDDWSGLAALHALDGLFLIAADEAVDLKLLTHVSGSLTAFSLIGAKRLLRLDGLASQARTLTHLALRSSIRDPPRGRREPLSLAGLGKLRELRRLELQGFCYAPEELTREVAKMAHVKVDVDEQG